MLRAVFRAAARPAIAQAARPLGGEVMVNGLTVRAYDQTILQLLDAHRMFVPRDCQRGECRKCAVDVEIDGMHPDVLACHEKVIAGLKIRTRKDDVDAEKKHITAPRVNARRVQADKLIATPEQVEAAAAAVACFPALALGHTTLAEAMADERIQTLLGVFWRISGAKPCSLPDQPLAVVAEAGVQPLIPFYSRTNLVEVRSLSLVIVCWAHTLPDQFVPGLPAPGMSQVMAAQLCDRAAAPSHFLRNVDDVSLLFKHQGFDEALRRVLTGRKYIV